MNSDLEEIKGFFKERILGWMITDLKRSVTAKTNFLTVLGCLTYTEVVGALLPTVSGETGSEKEKRFYRCFFRLPSEVALRELDEQIRQETSRQQGLYQHLRHNAAHAYYPRIRRRNADGTFSYMPVAVAKVAKKNGHIKGCPPMGIDSNGQFVIATENYTNELEVAWKEFYQKIVIEQEKEWIESAKVGMDFIARG